MTTRPNSPPLLAVGESSFYLHPLRTSQNQADILVGMGMLGALSRDLDKDGQCKTDSCRENWTSVMEDIGLAYSRAGLHVLSANFYRESLRNATDPATAHYNVAAELDSIGHKEAAQKEFDLALDEYKSKDIKFEEGLARFYLLTDRLDEARSHFEQCTLLREPAETVQYCAIGLALTKWSGGYDSMLLHLPSAGGWPGPILSFVRNQIDEKALTDAIAATPDPDRRRQRLCEALYYAGEHLLGQGNKELALRYFRASVRQRVESFWETGAAARRIEQLHGNSDPPVLQAPASHIPVG